MGLDMYLFTEANGERRQAAYWRKAHAVHGWFVANVQSGQDDCNDYPVTRTQIRKLLSVCKAAQRDWQRGSSGIPMMPVDGPFRAPWHHGAEVEATVWQLEALLAEPRVTGSKLYYRASW